MSESISINASGRKAIAATFIWLIAQGIIYFASVGSMQSLRGYIYFSSAMMITSFNALFMWLLLPGLTNERGTFKEDSKPIDKVYLSLFILIPVMTIPLAAGLEMRFIGKSFFGYLVMFVAVGLYILANALNLWSMSVNQHFEGTVRIQTDRKHKLICSGPYAYVRHPGYIAMIIGIIAGPLILGSVYALIPALIEVLVIISRTSYEDGVLHSELEGYKEYANDVRYRLIPGIW